MKKLFLLFALAVFVIALLSTGASASSNISYDGVVSPALLVISRDNAMVKTGFGNGDIVFSEKDFTSLIGDERIESVTILSLPLSSAGKLMLGALEVMENQTISASNLSSLRFVPQKDGERSECSFTFRAGRIAEYDMVCNIYVTNELNFAPTVAEVGEDELSISTYKNIAYFGTLPVSDPENDSLRFEILSYPKRGLISSFDKESGEFSYTPTRNYVGKDSFTYAVSDKYGNSTGSIRMEIKVSASESGAVFTDLIEKPCHNAAISLYDRGIISGENDGGRLMLCPEDKISGAELVCGVMKALGISDGDMSVGGDDAEGDDGEAGEGIPEEYRRYLAIAEAKGYLAHYGEGADAFEGAGSVTLAEACVLISRMMSPEIPSERPVFADGELIPTWASDALYSLEAIGVIEDDNGYISPNDELSREDLVDILYSLVR